MRLLKANADGSFSTTLFAPGHIPSYAILSHRWEAENQEVTLQDLTNGVAGSKRGYRKIQFCGQQAKNDGLEFFWVDSCSIDKSSSAELSEAINSMFRWYQNAAKCYVYLSDVSTDKHAQSSELLWESAFRRSQWFTRGWTLQELLAPSSVEFFSRDEIRLGDKQSLESQIQQVTGIPVQVLRGDSLLQFSVEERMTWAKNRETTREEDQAYCLMGIFNIHLPIIYGEGKENAHRRLQEEINKLSEEFKCLQALRTSDYEQFKDRNPDRLNGTCEWFLQHNHFQEWRQSSSGLLWVSADPGCGKSVLAKSLINREIKSTGFRTTCYFFFKDDNNKQKSLTTAFSSLLHQLFSQKLSLIQHAMQDYKNEGDYLPHSFYKLWNIFNKAISDPKAGEIICILDALDECAEVERYQIIDTLSTFYKQSQSSSQLKFLITSRPYSDIERKFADLIQHFPTIRLHGERELEAISHEVNIVVRSKVSELRQVLNLNDSEQSALQNELLAMKHRTYLWVTLIFKILHDELDPTEDKLRDIINTVPQTVDQAYEAILSRIKDKDKRTAKKLFQFIIVATRPLTLTEINIALAIEDHHQSFKDLRLSNHARFENTIKNLCGLFINIIDQRVYLIHQTAKEFLVAKNEARQDIWKHSLDPVESELLMARICITYLMFTDVNAEINTGDGIDIDDMASNAADAGSDSDNELHEIGPYEPSFQLTESHGYLNYAANFWSSHFRQAQSRATGEFLRLVVEICDIQSPRFHVWGRIFWKMTPPWSSYSFTSTTLVASYLGLETVVKLQLEQGSINLDSRDSDSGRTPLLWTVCNGYDAIVKLLLEANADVESKEDYGRTPLSLAAANGHEGIVKLLLEANADVESKYYGQTPLSFAAGNGHEGIVKLLLEANADVESKEEDGQTPLSLAAANGHKGIVKLLLEVNADVESKYYSRTPLSFAAANGHEVIVRLLLEANADVESKYFGRTPLLLAAGNGHEGIVKLLLEANADVESKGKNDQTPLSSAAANGHEGIVKLLLEANADVESKEDYGRTPLSFAAANGHEGIVKLLLEANADADSKEYHGRTPLSFAAENGHEGIVKLLLEANADADSKEYHGRTPLSFAAENGHEGIVKLLLEANADVDSKEYNGRTPLSFAAANGHEGIVKLLLEANADVESKYFGRTPLLLAAGNGHEGIVKLLLEANADVESKGKNDQTPLSSAAANGHEGIVKLLLEANADVESKEDYGRTPLSLAAANGQEGIVKLLLEANADVESKYFGRTPLLLAAGNGHEGIVKLLLEANADVESKGKNDQTPLSSAAANGHEGIVKLLLEANADVESKEDYGRTPLSFAAANGHEGIVKLLLEANADADSKEYHGRTPLSFAAENGHEGIVKLLLEANADVDSKEYNGRTPLSFTAANGHEGIVKLLLEANADVKSKDNFDGTPLDFAAVNGHEGILRLLKSMY